ncbi:MAG: response regulator transcription factor, partial [Candidatus Dormibacterales bacterium]
LRAGGRTAEAAHEEAEAREALRRLQRPSSDLSLTPREMEVVRLLARGLSNPAIASQLGLSPHTVHRHVASLLRRLDVPTRAAAAAEATRLGLV